VFEDTVCQSTATVCIPSDNGPYKELVAPPWPATNTSPPAYPSATPSIISLYVFVGDVCEDEFESENENSDEEIDEDIHSFLMMKN
jgi:hypothetical protein